MCCRASRDAKGSIENHSVAQALLLFVLPSPSGLDPFLRILQPLFSFLLWGSVSSVYDISLVSSDGWVVEAHFLGALLRSYVSLGIWSGFRASSFKTRSSYDNFCSSLSYDSWRITKL